MQTMVFKRGASHLGFVLAFVIFVMFLIFMYSAVEPMLKTQSDKQALIESLKLSFVKNLDENGEDVTITTVTNTTTITSQQDCISLQDIIGTGINQISESYVTGNNLIIKDSLG